jgi:hypothetical protein
MCITSRHVFEKKGASLATTIHEYRLVSMFLLVMVAWRVFWVIIVVVFVVFFESKKACFLLMKSDGVCWLKDVLAGGWLRMPDHYIP